MPSERERARERERKVLAYPGGLVPAHPTTPSCYIPVVISILTTINLGNRIYVYVCMYGGGEGGSATQTTVRTYLNMYT